MSVTLRATVLILNVVVLAPLYMLNVYGQEGQARESEVAAKITKLGGIIHKDEDGMVRSVQFGPKRGPTPFRDEDIESIDFGILSRLKSVTIASPIVTNRSLGHLRQAPPGLVRLTIVGAKVDDQEVMRLLRRHRLTLTAIHLVETPLTDRILAEIGMIEGLFSLSLRGTRITDKGLKSLKNLQELAVLNLAQTKISDAGLSDVGALGSLSTLVLEETQVTDAGILQLQLLKNLEWLYVSSTRVTENGKRTLQQLLPELEFRKDE